MAVFGFLALPVCAQSTLSSTNDEEEEVIPMNYSCTSLLSIVHEYLLKSFYYQSINGVLHDGSENAPFVITNYRQISLLSMYSFANFNLAASLYMPASYDTSPKEEAFYGYLNVVGSSVVKIYTENGETNKVFLAGSDIAYNTTVE